MPRDPLRAALALLICLAPGLAVAQVPLKDTGMPEPAPAAGASWYAALDQFNHSPETVVAKVGDHLITRADVIDIMREMPPIVDAVPLHQVFDNTARMVMQREALAEAAKAAGVDKEPAMRRRMENAGDEVLAEEMLRRSVAANVSEKALHELYDTAVAGKPGPDMVRARIIAVDSPDEADGLLNRLRDGGDFADLARGFSKDGTAANGGDLGYVRQDMLTPELGAVIFALAPGQMTQYPVRSGNHWFIIRVEGRQRQLAPPFSATRDALYQDVIHAATPELMRQALQQANATYYGAVGRPATVSSAK